MTEKILQLDPAKVLADANIRFALLPHRVEAMRDSILERGGVMTPVEVEPLTPPQNGHTHRLTVGFYRHAGALLANSAGAGVQLPAIVHATSSPADRLARQAAENLDRENLSPVDTAVAMSMMLEAGMTRDQLRHIFKRPGNGKTASLQPASKAFVSQSLALLKLPKPILAKVHDGRLGAQAAYELTTLPKEKHAEILERAEELRAKLAKREEVADARIEREEESASAKAEREAAEAKKLADAQDAVAKATEEDKAAKKAVLDAAKAIKEAKKVGPDFDATDKEQLKATAERVKAAKEEERKANKAAKDATNKLNKATMALRKLTKDDEPKPDTRGASPAKKAASPKVSDIRQAAKEVGAGAKAQPLTAADAREAAAFLAASKLATVKAIGQVFVKMLAGELTPKLAEGDLAVLTGEAKVKAAAKK